MNPVQIVGAGGIGCAVGYALHTVGVPVVFIESNTMKLRDGRQGKLQVGERASLRAEFIPFNDWIPAPESWVILCTKCYDNTDVLSRLTSTNRLLPIQNGFDIGLDALGHRYEGIASFVSECPPNSVRTRITRPGELHIGPRGQFKTAPPDLFAALYQAGMHTGLFRVIVVDDILPIKHSKLLYNAAISPLAAAAGIDNGQLLSHPTARRLFFGLLQENHRILRAAGFRLGKVGPFHPDTVAWILRRKWLARLLARRFEPSLRGTYCSMAGEIQKGRTELDNYNGYLIRIAERTGVPCPLNRAIFTLVASMTAERVIPHREVLESLSTHVD